MKKFCILIPFVFLMIACVDNASKQKVAEKIRKSVVTSCECTSVQVNFDVENTNYSRLIVDIEDNNQINLDEKAEKIISRLEENVPEISENDEIIIRFIQGEIIEEFSFEGNSKLSILENEDLKVVGLNE